MTNSKKLKNLKKTKKFSITYLTLILSIIIITILTSIITYIIIKNQIPKSIYNINPNTFNPKNYLKHSIKT